MKITITLTTQLKQKGVHFIASNLRVLRKTQRCGDALCALANNISSVEAVR